MQDVGLFSNLSSTPPTIASGTTLASTTGYAVEAKGAAVYSYDSTLTSSYVTDHPRSAFLDASGRVFRLADQVRERTPYMFGGVGDAATDDSAAVQAFFDDARTVANRRRCVYDWRGSWAVSTTIYATYPYAAEEPTGRFICGRLKVMAPAVSGTVTMEDVLVIAGYRNHWSGVLYIDGFTEAYAALIYDYRRFVNGVRLNSCGGSTFDTIRVDGAKRDSVKLDSAGATFRAGTAYETSFSGSNNIALRFGTIYSRSSGSCHQRPNFGLSVAFSTNEYGGNDGQHGFITTTDYSGSVLQRSRLTVASTAQLKQGDYGKVRLELDASTYGTIAASNSAGTLTWSTGDPVAAGLAVGQKFQLRSGANATVQFEIVGFSGTSNRTITVWPKPANEAATAVSALWTKFSIHWIDNIDAANNRIEVYPWVAPHVTGTWYSMHGWVLNAPGADAANLTAELVAGNECSCVMNCAGLFGPNVASVLADVAEITVAQGLSPQASGLGTVIEHIHSENAEVDFLQLNEALTQSRAIVKGGSSLSPSRILRLAPRASTTDPLPPAVSLLNVSIDAGGDPIMAGLLPAYSGNGYGAGIFGLSNDPQTRLRTIIANSATLDLNFDADVARIAGEHHWAELFWIGPSGGAPSGSLTLQLSDELAFKGWTIAGVSSPITVTKPCAFKLRFDRDSKKVMVARFDAA